ncbi:MAG: MFS transporter [Rubrobacteraceae bacterium]
MRRLLFLTCAIVLADTVFYGVLVPLVPYFSDEFGLTKGEVGILNGAMGIGIILGSVPGAYLTSRLGVKGTAILGLLLLVATSLPFGFVGEYWMLVALRLGEGFASALSWISAFTWIFALAPEEHRGQMLGTLISAAVVGALIGPALGGAAGAVGIAPVFIAVALLGLGVAFWTLLTPAPTSNDNLLNLRSLGAVFHPRLATGLWLITLSPILFSALAVLSPLELSRLGWGTAAIGVVFLLGAAAEATIHPLAGRWSDRAGYRPPILTALLISFVILVSLPWAANPYVLGLMVVSAAVFFNFPLAPGTALFTDGTEKSGIEPAVAFAATNFFWASGYAVGAPLGGFLADLGGDALAYLFLAPVCLLSLFLVRKAI